VDGRGWTGVLAPVGLPDDIVRKINADLRTVLDLPEVRSQLEGAATYVRHMNPTETREVIRAEQKAWRPVVKQFGVTSR
jgi:tripartite-type tricarboxylate transporter receptor subunit TctC